MQAEEAAAAAAEARRAARGMRLARDEGRNLAWGEMAPSCRTAAGVFGFTAGVWSAYHGDREQGWRLVERLIKHEWWRPWDALPRAFKLAALDLGYDGRAWEREQLPYWDASRPWMGAAL